MASETPADDPAREVGRASTTARDAPLVSVVLPTYRRPDFLREAVDSVRDQTHAPVELVVVDGAPDPDTRAALADRVAGDVERFRYVEQDASSGAAAARNLGIERSTGPYVAFLDDDDRWEPSTLERQLDAFDGAGEDVGVVYTGMRYESGADGGRGDFRPDIEGDVTRRLLCGNFVGSFSRVMVSRGAVEAAGPIDERYDVWEDWEWYVRLSRRRAFRAVEAPLVVRRGGHGRDQLSHDVRRTYEEAYPRFVAAYRPLAASHGRLFERKFLGCVNFRLGWAALMREAYGVARRTLARAVYYYPTPRFLAVFALAVGGPAVRRAYGALPRPVTRRVGGWLRRWS